MEIPFTTAPRPDTGLYNAQLGIWLFLASEVMLFGALFSAYALLRTGAAVWPHGWERLNVPLGSCNTILMIASSVTMARGVSRLRKDDWRRGGQYLGTTLILGLAFLAIKMFEYREHLLRGEVPARDNFFAVYFTLTGLHALHVLGGVVVLAYLLGPGAALRRSNQQRQRHRFVTTGLYWQFVDAVWILMFATVYLL